MAARVKHTITATEVTTSESVAERTKAAEASVKEPPRNKEAVNTTSFVVYLGPTIQNVIQNATIFPGTLEEVKERLAWRIEKYPRIKVLLSTGETIVEDRRNVDKPGTRLYVEYHRLIHELTK